MYNLSRKPDEQLDCEDILSDGPFPGVTSDEINGYVQHLGFVGITEAILAAESKGKGKCIIIKDGMLNIDTTSGRDTIWNLCDDDWKIINTEYNNKATIYLPIGFFRWHQKFTSKKVQQSLLAHNDNATDPTKPDESPKGLRDAHSVLLKFSALEKWQLFDTKHIPDFSKELRHSERTYNAIRELIVPILRTNLVSHENQMKGVIPIEKVRMVAPRIKFTCAVHTLWVIEQHIMGYNQTQLSSNSRLELIYSRKIRRFLQNGTIGPNWINSNMDDLIRMLALGQDVSRQLLENQEKELEKLDHREGEQVMAVSLRRNATNQ